LNNATAAAIQRGKIEASIEASKLILICEYKKTIIAISLTLALLVGAGFFVANRQKLRSKIFFA